MIKQRSQVDEAYKVWSNFRNKHVLLAEYDVLRDLPKNLKSCALGCVIDTISANSLALGRLHRPSDAGKMSMHIISTVAESERNLLD